jgi:allantoinase
MRADPGLYSPWPGGEAPRITWPNGARVAFWVAPNIEFYELAPPMNPQRPAWPRPWPDVYNYTQRDYGNRVGHFRLMEALDRCGVRGSVSLSVAMCQHHPELIAAGVERDWEFFSHGIYNTRYSYGMDEAQERAIIEDSIRTVREATGQRIAGWLAPALTHTERTVSLLAEYGLLYTCDLFHEDRPQPLNVPRGRLISMPYSLELNDHVVYNDYRATPRVYGDMIRRQFDRLFAEGERSGTVMCIPLHAYLVGHPHRIRAFESALRYITTHHSVWVTTAREIAAWYYENHYSAAAL